MPLMEAVASGAVSPFIHLGGCGPDQKEPLGLTDHSRPEIL